MLRKENRNKNVDDNHGSCVHGQNINMGHDFFYIFFFSPICAYWCQFDACYLFHITTLTFSKRVANSLRCCLLSLLFMKKRQTIILLYIELYFLKKLTLGTHEYNIRKQLQPIIVWT